MKIYFLIIPVIIGILFGTILVSVQEESPTDSSLLNKENLQKGSTILGNENAKFSIVEFGDYQCTACFRFHENTLSKIKDDLIKTNKVNFAFRDYPLNGQDSILAAEATYCSQEQEMFWEFHEKIYQNWNGENTGWVNQQSLTQFANEIGLNMEEFDECMENHRYFQHVIDNERFANEIGINATPTFLIFNDKEIIRIVGSHPIEKFHAAINQLND